MQIILGAGGVIGRHLARLLPEYTDRVRLVGRLPQKVLPDNEVFAADLTDADAVNTGLKGCDIAYLIARLPYDHKVWQADWPRVTDNAIVACRAHDCKLVFFDNMQMYDRDRGRSRIKHTIAAVYTY